MVSPAHKKLRAKELVDFANQVGSASRTSIIVEAHRPRISLTAMMKLGTRLIGAPIKDRPPPKAGRQRLERHETHQPQMGAVETVLKRMGLLGLARRNDLAGAFVVEVTPSQLRELADAPEVQAIRPNRFHRRLESSCG